MLSISPITRKEGCYTFTATSTHNVCVDYEKDLWETQTRTGTYRTDTHGQGLWVQIASDTHDENFQPTGTQWKQILGVTQLDLGAPKTRRAKVIHYLLSQDSEASEQYRSFIENAGITDTPGQAKNYYDTFLKHSA